MLLLYTILFLSFLVIPTSLASDWIYPNEIVNTIDNKQVTKWGGICESGRRQSPINLNQRGAGKIQLQELQFKNYEKSDSGAMLTNTGHTVRISDFTSEQMIKGGPLHDEYILETVDFHWPSEHTIDNVRYPLETQLVHRNLRYSGANRFTQQIDAFVVVSVLHFITNAANDEIEKIQTALSEVADFKNIDRAVRINSSIVVGGLFEGIEYYYTYMGSFTTPPCSESVQWIILMQKGRVSESQLNKFREIEWNRNGDKLQNNYRSHQFNRLPVYLTMAEVSLRNESNTLDVPVVQILFTILVFVVLAHIL